MLNHWRLEPNRVVITIKKRNGTTLECFVDVGDLSRLISFNKSWCAFWSPTARTWYAYCRGKRVEGKQEMILLHRFLLDTPSDLHTDHKDHNGLNNCRDNIRAVTRSVNQLNHRNQSNNTSGHRGVVWDATRSLWQARVKVNGKQILLGRYGDAREANAVVTRYRIEQLRCLA